MSIVSHRIRSFPRQFPVISGAILSWIALPRRASSCDPIRLSQIVGRPSAFDTDSLKSENAVRRRALLVACGPRPVSAVARWAEPISGAEWRYCDVSIEWPTAIPAITGSAVTASGNFASIVVPAIGSTSHAQVRIVLCCSLVDPSAVSRRILRPLQRSGLTTGNGDEQDQSEQEVRHRAATRTRRSRVSDAIGSMRRPTWIRYSPMETSRSSCWLCAGCRKHSAACRDWRSSPASTREHGGRNRREGGDGVVVMTACRPAGGRFGAGKLKKILRNHDSFECDHAATWHASTRLKSKSSLRVKRNSSRFPGDFMFQLTAVEAESLRSQVVTLDGVAATASSAQGRGKHLKYRPYALTEQGVATTWSLEGRHTAVAITAKVGHRHQAYI